METTTLRLYSLDWREKRTYLFAALFIVGNIVLPQLCHLIPQGGLMLLPIYFFTLVGAYKYGIRVGLLTAVLSPLINSLLFGMPPAAALPVIVTKSVVLACAAAWIARRSGKASLLALLCVVIVYQLVGGCAEWAITGQLSSALQDWQIGYPGMIIQVVGGYLVINHLLHN